MAIDFSSLDATPAHTGKIDFSSIGGIPAVGQDEPTDETTTLGAAGRGAVGMIPLGEQAYSAVAGMAEGKPYLQERQDLEKAIEADKANHGMARLAGQAAGIAAPALLTGGASAPASMAGAMGEGAMIGAGFGAGNAIDTLASGQGMGKAAGDVALGAGLGAAGGALGQKLAGMAGKAVPTIEKFAARKAAQGVGLGSEELGNMSQQEVLNTGKFLMDKNIVKPGASTQEMFDTAKALHEGYGQKIGQIGNQATELGLTTDTKPMLDVLSEKLNAASELRNPDARKAAVQYKAGIADIMMMANRNGAERVAPDILTEQPASFITFDQLQHLKKSYGNSAFENGAVKNAAAADVYGQLNIGQKAIVNKASENPKLPAELKDAMAGYSRMYPVVNGLQDVLGRERAGNMPAKGFGMVGKMVGQLPGQDKPAINALTALGLVGMGHPMWGIGAATATLQNPRAMSSVAQGLAKIIPEAAEKLPTITSQIAAGEAHGGAMHRLAEKATEQGFHHTAEHAIHQNMGETKSAHTPSNDFTTQNILQPTLGADLTKEKAPTALNLNHPALAPWKQIFDKNAASAKDEGELKKSQAVTDFVLSQRDHAYPAAKQKMAENPMESAINPAKMAEGGLVEEIKHKLGKPVPGFGGTLPGLEEQMRHPTHEAPPAPQDTLPTRTTQKFHEPFNTDMEEKLKIFLMEQRGDQNGRN